MWRAALLLLVQLLAQLPLGWASKCFSWQGRQTRLASSSSCPHNSPPHPAADYVSASRGTSYHIPTTSNSYYYIWGAQDYCDDVTTAGGTTLGAGQYVLVYWTSNAEQKEVETALFTTGAHPKSNRRGWALRPELP